jgi:riboflavin biosynthesis protein RibD
MNYLKKQVIFTKEDRKFMRIAIGLAEKAKGNTSPNPMVGAVIVKNGKILAKGFHRQAGYPHAEIEGIDSCKNKEDLQGSVMYVTLEPCSIYGKTPPCTDSITKHKIKKVIIGSIDPNPEVNGRGIETLKNAGVEVYTGLFSDNIEKQNEVFFKHIKSKMPFISCKIASSIDGKMATKTSDSKWITSAESREFVQKIRKEYDCILTGINTICADDPYLFPQRDIKNIIKNTISKNEHEDFINNNDNINYRRNNNSNNKNEINNETTIMPDIAENKAFYRVVLDSNLRTDPNTNLVKTAQIVKTIIFTAKEINGRININNSNGNTSISNDCNNTSISINKSSNNISCNSKSKIDYLTKNNIDIIQVNPEHNEENDKNLTKLNLNEVIGTLYKKYGITSILIESGPTLVTSFLTNNLIDKFYFFIAPKIIGGDSKYDMFSELNIQKINDTFKLKFEKIKQVGKDLLIIAYPVHDLEKNNRRNNQK